MSSICMRLGCASNFKRRGKLYRYYGWSVCVMNGESVITCNHVINTSCVMNAESIVTCLWTVVLSSKIGNSSCTLLCFEMHAALVATLGAVQDMSGIFQADNTSPTVCHLTLVNSRIAKGNFHDRSTQVISTGSSLQSNQPCMHA